MSNRSRFLRAARRVSLHLAWICPLFLCGFGLRTSVNAEDKPAQSRFKNLKILKDVPSDQMIPAMQFISASLGVECEFCHATDPTTHRPNYASDANSDKAIARTMITMTREINAKFMSQVKDPDATPADKTVTCGTCHRGNSMPAPFGAVVKMGDKMGAHHDDDKAPPSEKKPE